MSTASRTKGSLVKIGSEADVATARKKGRELATAIGFSRTDSTLITTAISELAHNIVTHAGRGNITIRRLSRGRQKGIAVVAHDDGPGIADVKRVLEDVSPSRSMGLGLRGTRDLMDEFEIDSGSGKGTRVTTKKWVW